jgi:hypothetical protein
MYETGNETTNMARTLVVAVLGHLLDHSLSGWFCGRLQACAISVHPAVEGAPSADVLRSDCPASKR